MDNKNLKMNVGDLVFDLPFGKEWFKNNPFLSGNEQGIVLEIVDFETVFVMWQTGKITYANKDNIWKINDERLL